MANKMVTAQQEVKKLRLENKNISTQLDNLSDERTRLKEKIKVGVQSHRGFIYDNRKGMKESEIWYKSATTTPSPFILRKTTHKHSRNN